MVILPFANKMRKSKESFASRKSRAETIFGVASIRPQDNKDFLKERRKSIYPKEFVTHPRPDVVKECMVPLPRVIEACAVLNAKTEQNVALIQNQCLEETRQCLAAVQLHDQEAVKRSDIEILKADVAAMSDKLDIATTDVARLQTSLDNFKAEILSMLSSGGHSQVTAVDNADCEQYEQATSSGKVLFLTVKHDGEDQNLYLTRCARDALLVLFDWGVSSSYAKGQLPPLHAKFAEAAVLKLFPPNPKLKEIINDDGTTKYDDDIKVLKSEVRTKITSILEYYFKQYDSDGVKIPEKKTLKRKKPEDLESGDLVEDLAQ
ncbi:unnamed protein product [Allacma fusca]|uniref:Uncharacterized protein n=1 Tax=Allacma fusca TaxID=39272 RepID=A0A8J2KEX2_9HEXA|nr:unnamed protein product [Allacma fusca]